MLEKVWGWSYGMPLRKHCRIWSSNDWSTRIFFWRRFKWKYRINEWTVERFFPGLLAQYKFKRYSSVYLLWSRGLWDLDYLSSGVTVKMDCWSFSSSFLISHFLIYVWPTFLRMMWSTFEYVYMHFCRFFGMTTYLCQILHGFF